jgi:hypothetical protein
VQGVTVSFTCLPDEQDEPGDVLDPGEFGGGHTALAFEPELLGRLASYEFVADADPYVVIVDPGTNLAVNDIDAAVDAASAELRPIRFEIRSELDISGE